MEGLGFVKDVGKGISIGLDATYRSLKIDNGNWAIYQKSNGKIVEVISPKEFEHSSVLESRAMDRLYEINGMTVGVESAVKEALDSEL